MLSLALSFEDLSLFRQRNKVLSLNSNAMIDIDIPSLCIR